MEQKEAADRYARATKRESEIYQKFFLLFSFLFSDFSRSELNRIHIADSFRGIIAQLGEFFNTN